MTIDLTDAIFHDESKAREWLEQSRWPNGVFCPHCGSVSVVRLAGKASRPGLFQCRDCRGQFTVTTGGVMESSKVPLTKWAMAIRLMASSKKGLSAHQLHRSIGVTYKTAWFMFHRLREAMSTENTGPLGGDGKVIEVDEMYHGKRGTPAPMTRQAKHQRRPNAKPKQKREVLALVERGGEARAKHVNHITGKNVREFLSVHADRKSRLHTDESTLYKVAGEDFATHETVLHYAKEFARGDVTTNSIEGFFGILKRGMVGVYQHCGEQHFQRYIDEFTFRYNARTKLGVTDTERAVRVVKGAEGKRLTYRRITRHGEGMEGAASSI